MNSQLRPESSKHDPRHRHGSTELFYKKNIQVLEDSIKDVQAKSSIPFANITDAILGTPTTAHILGGAVMGQNELAGVIDKNCCIFGYKNMMVCDGSIISANPGVNPSLTITAISEYAMAIIPNKNS